MTLLVTGGAGFIGSALVRRVLADDQQLVVNVDKLTYAADSTSIEEFNGNGRHILCEMDVCNTSALNDVFAEYQPDAVVHLAAESHVDRSLDAPASFISTNVLGTYSLLEVSLEYWAGLDQERQNLFRFIHVSTDEVYGSATPEQMFSGTDPYCPNSPYAASKASADHLVRAWNQSFGLPAITCNSTNNYGPHQYPEKLIPLTIAKALSDEAIPVYGDGKHMRDWIHVDDHVEGLLLALKRGTPGHSYLFGSGQPRCNIDVVNAVCRLLESHAERSSGEAFHSLIRYVTDRPGHDRRYAADSSFARKTLQWQPRISFDTGLERTVLWYLNNPDWWRTTKRNRRGLDRERDSVMVGEAQVQ